MAPQKNNKYDSEIRRLTIEGLNAREIYMFLNIHNRTQGLPDCVSYRTVLRRYNEYVKIYLPWKLELLPHEELFRVKPKSK